MTEAEQPSKKPTAGPVEERKPGGRSWGRVAGALAGGALLMFIGWGMFSDDYREPQRALSEGVPGRFTLYDCASSRGKTACGGSFRSDDGKVVREEVSLPNKHDASGLERGESFPAYLRPRKDGEYGPEALARSDAEGRSNITQKGVSTAAFGVIGVMVLGFAVRGAVLKRGGTGWSGTGLVLGTGVVLSIGTYVVASVMGSGFWA
ncbi:hypothetical protein [Spirillospora sp. NPDC029432]|uniref:hypothetical protein n=1 Tax=Spirillospora sp. NPDC029432 TaxID=3154599 RepID=UPI003453AFD4